MKAYLSSKITGLNPDEYIKNFNRLENKYKKSYILVNPLLIHGNKKKSYLGYLIKDIIELLKCHVVIFDSNYKQSRGCKIEHFISKITRKRIIYETKPIYNDYLIIYEAGKNVDGKLIIGRNSRLIKARSISEAIQEGKVMRNKKGIVPFILSINSEKPDYQLMLDIKLIK